MTTEIERLASLGRKYLFAAGKLVGFAGSETELTHAIGNGSGFARLIIDVAKVIATADRQEATHGTRKYENHILQWPSEQFEYYWEDHDSFDYLLDDDDVLVRPAPGDLLHLREYRDHSATGRSIIFQISNVFMHPDERQHVIANFVTRKGGTHD